mmetsp:Transcript_6723/g.25343  ORF Transcript_6723/g.25343 Transcript_6723/m.25343 type:complete len:203 (-) Transcript_6723:1126-1734(-)
MTQYFHLYSVFITASFTPVVSHRPAPCQSLSPPRISPKTRAPQVSAAIARNHFSVSGLFSKTPSHPKYVGKIRSMNIHVGNNAASAKQGSGPHMNGPSVVSSSSWSFSVWVFSLNRFASANIFSTASICFAIVAISSALFATPIGPRYIHPCTGAMYKSCTRVANIARACWCKSPGINSGPICEYFSRRNCAMTSDSGSANP